MTKRIALVSSTFFPSIGGAQVVVHNTARALAECGYDPYVIVNYKNYLYARGHDLGVKVLPLPPVLLRGLASSPKLVLAAMNTLFAAYQARYGFSLWHANVGYPAGVLVGDFCRRRGLPCTLRCAGDDIQVYPEVDYGLRRDPRIDALCRRYYPGFDRVIAITETVSDEYRALGIPDERIVPIPNGVDLNQFPPLAAGRRSALRDQLGIAEDDFVFISVGRNHPKKGFSTLVDAAALLRERGLRRFKVLFVGPGFEQIQADIAARGLEEHFRFDVVSVDTATLGAVPALPPRPLVERYQMADTFVLPSYVETFGVVLIEAMAAGLPILTTDAPGCRDVVRDGIDGTLFPPGDGAALAGLMERLITDGTERQRLAAGARSAAAGYALDRVVARYVDLFESLMK